MNKRPIYMKRDLYSSLQLMCATDMYEKRRMFVKREALLFFLSLTETYVCEKKPLYMKRDLDTSMQLMCATNTHLKRDLHIFEKRPIIHLVCAS